VVNGSSDDKVNQRLVAEGHNKDVKISIKDSQKFDLAVSKDLLDVIVYDTQRLHLPSAVIPRLSGVVDYFTLAVLRQFESLGVKLFNSVNAIEIARDNLYTHQILSASGLPIPRSVLSRTPFDADYITQHFSFPVILRYSPQAKDEQVIKINNVDELKSRVESLDQNKPIIFQDYSWHEIEYNVRAIVVGDKVLGFVNNPRHHNGALEILSGNSEVTCLASRAASLCEMDFANVDFIHCNHCNSYKISKVCSFPSALEYEEKVSGSNVLGSMVDYIAAKIHKLKKEGTLRKIINTTNIPLQPDHVI